MEVNFKTECINEKYYLNSSWIKKIERVLLYKLGNKIYKYFYSRQIAVIDIQTKDDITDYFRWNGKKGTIHLVITIRFHYSITKDLYIVVKENIDISFKVNNKIFFIDEYLE